MFLRAVLACCALSFSSALVMKPKFNSDPCPFGYGTGCNEFAHLDSNTKAKVAGILRGMLNNLSGKKGLVQQAQKVTLADHSDTMEPQVKETLIALSAKLALSNEDKTATKALSKMIYSKWE